MSETAHRDTLFELARVHALLGNGEEACTWLDRAADVQYWDVERLMTDEAFAALRDGERFRRVIKGIRIARYLAMLERAEREDFQKRDRVMEALALVRGERVAYVGVGSGYFVLPVARAVGPSGLILGCDVEQAMLDHVEKRARREGVVSLKLRLVRRDDPGLAGASFDSIIMIDTWHYLRDRSAYARRLATALAPRGRVVIIDYIPKSWDERPFGPAPETQLPREAVDADMAEAGLRPIKVHDFLPEQYFVEYAA